MTRRPLHTRFSQAVLERRKITTIREKAWPIGKPIMLFNWSGTAYRSKQIDVAAVIVTAATPIDISLGEFSDCVTFSEIMGLGRPLWECEGFNGPLDMNDWFLPKLKPGQTLTKILHRFELYQPGEISTHTKTAPALSAEQRDILHHTIHRAAGGRYCGGGPDMDRLVELGYMEYLGTPGWCPDPFYRITRAGREALRSADSLAAPRKRQATTPCSQNQPELPQNHTTMNDLKMNIAGTIMIGHETAKSYATISNTGEIEITGSEDEIRQCIENTPQHLKFAGHLVLEIMRLRRALGSANVTEHTTPRNEA